jgi:hypothetical protein
MTDHRTTADQAKPTGTDTTSGAVGAGSDKASKPGDPPAKSAGVDASDALLDGAVDTSYQKMLAANKAASSDSGGKTQTTAANHDLQQKGVLSHLTVTYHEPGQAAPKDVGRPVKSKALTQAAAVADSSTPTTDGAGDLGKTPANDKLQRLAYLQSTVQNFLPIVLAPAKGQPDAALQRSIAQKQDAIKAEAARGEFGPETKAAYGQYVDWLQKTAIPSTVRDLQMFKLPLDERGGKGAKAPPLDLKIDKNDVPDDKQLQRLDDAVKWAQSADGRVQVAQTDLLKKVDTEFTATVTRLNLPNGWIQDIDQDHSRWRRTVGPLIDNALTARSNLEILDELSKAGSTNSLASILPPNMDVQRDASGKIKNVHLDLPRGWDLKQPDNKSKADALSALVAETNALVAPTIPQLQTIASHPERAVNWGDTEVRGMKGKFDSQNNFLGLCGKDDKPVAGEHTADVNLVESRFNIEEKDGKIVVHQHVQAQSVPWWGYQNLIGVENVGNKIDITRTFNPTDNVVVRTDSGYEVKQAQDLASYKNWQMAKHYGEKGLMGVLDVGMVVSGTIEVGAAFKAARLAGVGIAGLDLLGRGTAKGLIASEGLEVSSRALTLQAGKGLMRTTVGMTGLLNNAGARESNFGQTVNTARSIYFLTDATLGLGKLGINSARSVLGSGAEAGAGAGKLTIAGITAGSKTENFYRLTHGAFKLSEYGFMPLAAIDLTKGIQKVNNDKNAHVVRAAEIVASDQGKPKDSP